MSDWGHEGHMGPRKTYCVLTRAREADNSILVAPRGPHHKNLKLSAIPWGHLLTRWGHVQPVATRRTEKVPYADPTQATQAAGQSACRRPR